MLERFDPVGRRADRRLRRRLLDRDQAEDGEDRVVDPRLPAGHVREGAVGSRPGEEFGDQVDAAEGMGIGARRVDHHQFPLEDRRAGDRSALGFRDPLSVVGGEVGEGVDASGPALVLGVDPGGGQRDARSRRW